MESGGQGQGTPNGFVGCYKFTLKLHLTVGKTGLWLYHAISSLYLVHHTMGMKKKSSREGSMLDFMECSTSKNVPFKQHP